MTVAIRCLTSAFSASRVSWCAGCTGLSGRAATLSAWASARSWMGQVAGRFRGAGGLACPAGRAAVCRRAAGWVAVTVQTA